MIALAGDTSAIDTTWRNLAHWRNAVKGTIQVKRRGTATITEPILIATSCGTNRGYVGIEPSPGGGPFAAYIFYVQGAPDAACFLGPVGPTTGLAATVTGFVNVPSTKGPITLTSSSLVTFPGAKLKLAQTTLLQETRRQSPRRYAQATRRLTVGSFAAIAMAACRRTGFLQ